MQALERRVLANDGMISFVWKVACESKCLVATCCHVTVKRPAFGAILHTPYFFIARLGCLDFRTGLSSESRCG